MEYWGFSICEGESDRSPGQTLADLLKHVDIADRSGMDGWFFAEHHGNPDYSLTPSPNLLVAASSQRTTNIRLGNMVTVIAFHHPLRVAEEIRMLDALTGGRLETGFGRGGFPQERAGLGIEGDAVDPMFGAGLELILRFLDEGSVDYDTAWWRGKGATAAPGPTQRPRPPLWLAAVSDATLRQAAQLGLHCNTSFSYPELLRERMAMYRETWEQHHGRREHGKFGVLVQVVVGETHQEAVRYGKACLQRRIERFVKGFGFAPPGADGRNRLYEHLSPLTVEEFVDEGMVIFGSVEECVEQLQQLRAAQVDVVTAWLRFEGMDEGFARASLGRFVQEVIPRIEQREPAAASAVSDAHLD